MSETIEHRFAEINGIRMHYAIAGRGEPILFLHGFPEYWGVWKRQMDAFSSDHLVIAPDQRGYNLTSRPSEVSDYHIKHLIADVRALCDHLGLEQVFIVAQDWGALVAWSFLLRHPERVRGYVSIDVTHPHLFNEALRSDPAQQQASQYMLVFRSAAAEPMFEANDHAFAREAIFNTARAHGATITEQEEADWMAAMTQPGAITAGLNYYRAAEIGPPDGKGSRGGSNLLDDLDPEQYKVDVPVQVIFGEQDPYLLTGGLDRLHYYVRDLSIFKVPDADHWVSLERPDLVNRRIRERLRCAAGT